jgi:alkanesulfonate monooxygenase SsuD/methylene tetrahydromethanopterin reductase-like flavin-dependent oxidoreductase (luciferase family)
MMLAGEGVWIGSTIGPYSDVMRVGIGLPNTNPGLDGRLIVDWARKAEAGPFTSLGVLDRAAYDSIEPFMTLAAAAAAPPRSGW